MKRWLRLSILVALAVISVAMAFIFDAPMREWVNAHQSDGPREFMRNVSRLGDWWSHAALGIVLLAIAWWRGNKKWTGIFLSMLIACALAGATTRVIKI
ncbi:MAG: hypothetical protein QOI22_42, partial [Verrucomicrobiota bacterium]